MFIVINLRVIYMDERIKQVRKALKWHLKDAPKGCFKVKCVECNKKGYDSRHWFPGEGGFEFFIEDDELDRDEGYLCWNCAPDPDPPTGDPWFGPMGL